MPEVCTNTVLLVDDDSDTRKLFSIFLKKAGFKVLHAVDGIDAIVKLRDTIPNVIASGLLTPRMSGTEFVSVVRRRFPHIPVVFVSRAIPNEVPAEAEPDVWLNKNTLHPSEFVATVQTLARRVPDRIDLPQVVPTSIQIPPGVAVYFILTCTDCLRTFRATSIPKAVEGTAVCTYCEACVPFLIEGSAPDSGDSADQTEGKSGANGGCDGALLPLAESYRRKPERIDAAIKFHRVPATKSGNSGKHGFGK
jgi:CheY-like chemotaxis protein